MEEKITNLKKIARHAGFLYLMIVFIAPYAHIYVPSKIYLREDAVATTKNILAYEFLFRTCVVANLLEATIFVFLAFTLFRLLRQVNFYLARVMLTFVVVQIPIIFVLAAFKITALMIAKGEITSTFLPGNVPEVTMLFLKLNEYGMMTLELLWGLWLFPFGMLIYKSMFIPRVFGVFLVIAGAGYAIDSLTFMLAPQFTSYTKIFAFTFSGIGETSIMLWLLIIGVKDHVSIEGIDSEPVLKTSAI
ncbi:MAG TPA: DUF4386 domain-containing protein [Flavisolibacter sp.]|nr:DUF4386 domain-containing protein [Flavisolibacter sp.]